MRRDTGIGDVKGSRGAKTGVGAKATGIFKRIADAERQSGMKRITRHTQPENLKK
jgi:hypothetical protein